jgi:hypothetical protein
MSVPTNAAGFTGGFRFPERVNVVEQTRPSCSKRVATGTSNSGHTSVALCEQGGVAVTGLPNPEIRRRADRRRAPADAYRSLR